MLFFTILFFVLSVICAIGWLTTKISVLILAWYLTEKNVPRPTDADLKKGSDYVVKSILKDLLH